MADLRCLDESSGDRGESPADLHPKSRAPPSGGPSRRRQPGIAFDPKDVAVAQMTSSVDRTGQGWTPQNRPVDVGRRDVARATGASSRAGMANALNDRKRRRELIELAVGRRRNAMTIYQWLNQRYAAQLRRELALDQDRPRWARTALVGSPPASASRTSAENPASRA
jgi:hypothetical protein